MMRISINCPSYKRKVVETLAYIPFCKVWVDGDEYRDYIKNNPKGANIIKCRKGVQGNLCRVRNYIIDTEFKHGADVVCIIDDDMKGLYYWEKKEKHKLTADGVMRMLEKFSIMAKDMGAYFWGVNVNQDKQVYREHTPFSTVSYIGGPFQVFLRGGELRYDERLNLKEDYDMTLQQLNKYRRVLRVNKYFYDVKQSEQIGGCSASRNMDRERDQFILLQKKWGNDIVRRDGANRSHNLKRHKVNVGYNPIISVPIKGV
jgi:hypothetical protein